MNLTALRAIPLLFAVLLCHCGAPRPPQCVRVPLTSRQPAALLITAAREDWAILANPHRTAAWPAAEANYNATVAKLFDQLSCAHGGWERRADTLGTRIAPVADHQIQPADLDALFPASRVHVSSAASRRQTTAGVGLPLVGWKKTSPVGTPRAAFLPPTGQSLNITATLAFEGSAPPVWSFTQRGQSRVVAIGKTHHLLAANWAAPNAFFWQMCHLDLIKIENALLPERFSQETGLYFLQPYDPQKTPVVFIHGLASSPNTFKKLITELSAEPWFRDHYQVWLFNYPTGTPWIYSGIRFREQIRAAAAHGRSLGGGRSFEQMVLISHSMGGLIARSSVTPPGTTLYEAFFNRPIDQLKVSAPTRKLIRDATRYQPLTEPKKIILLAVPHHGSPTANLHVSLWLSRLIRLPKNLTIDLVDATLQGIGNLMDGTGNPLYPSTSINSLAPNSKAITGLNQLPLPRTVSSHSIIGDRGKGDSPASSDGWVPYTSSHLAGVASELIVPSYHSVQNHPQAIGEIKRILQLHLRSSTDR